MEDRRAARAALACVRAACGSDGARAEPRARARVALRERRSPRGHYPRAALVPLVRVAECETLRVRTLNRRALRTRRTRRKGRRPIARQWPAGACSSSGIRVASCANASTCRTRIRTRTSWDCPTRTFCGAAVCSALAMSRRQRLLLFQQSRLQVRKAA